jgi:hypothetical protein
MGICTRIEIAYWTLDNEIKKADFDVIAKPGQKIFVGCEILTRTFLQNTSFEYADLSKLNKSCMSAESLWIGAMQKWLVHNVYILTENPQKGYFVFYNFMNESKYPALLGKLIPQKGGSMFYDRFNSDVISFLKCGEN